MTVAALVTDESQAEAMLSWGQFLAESETTDLTLIVFQKTNGSREWGDVQNLDESSSTSRWIHELVEKLQTSAAKVDVSIRLLRDSSPEWALVEEIGTMNISLLLLPEFSMVKSASEAESWRQSLYRRSPCETMQLSTQGTCERRPLNVLVTATGRADDSTAIRRGYRLARQSGGGLTVSYFEPDIDVVALDVGKKILANIVDNALGSLPSDVSRQVVLANSFSKGLSFFDLSQFDLAICGTRNSRQSKKFLANSGFKGEKRPFALATVRKPIPLTSRFVGKIQNFFEGFIPQLKREQRVDLVQRIQSSSKWDFDFGILICLSTLIAALGLIRDSASVVIGAMLVAPLMTPIVGAGLGLAQSNIHLVSTSLRTVLRGFATAFMIGVLIGLIFQPTVSQEMDSRGHPNFLDLIVALVSGIAAAYALGRPNLLSALPGVAIAAALVPPLATSGMALAIFEFHLSYGSLLLFLTNIIAIILGTTITFWTVGIRRAKSDTPAQSWPLWLFFLFVLLSIILTVVMSLGV